MMAAVRTGGVSVFKVVRELFAILMDWQDRHPQRMGAAGTCCGVRM
jgi:hypothetical protein